MKLKNSVIFWALLTALSSAAMAADCPSILSQEWVPIQKLETGKFPHADDKQATAEWVGKQVAVKLKQPNIGVVGVVKEVIIDYSHAAFEPLDFSEDELDSLIVELSDGKRYRFNTDNIESILRLETTLKNTDSENNRALDALLYRGRR